MARRPRGQSLGWLLDFTSMVPCGHRENLVSKSEGFSEEVSLALGRLLIGMAVLMAAAFTLPSFAHADQSARWAPSLGSAAPQTKTKAMWGPAAIDGKSQFPIYRDLGVGIYQMAVAWSDIAPTKPAEPTNPGDPAYVWPAGLEQTLREARTYGMRVTLMVIGAPPWANGGESDRAWAPKKPADYADFMTAISTKYPSIKMWMVWGEPNRRPNFKPLIPSRTGPLTAKQAKAPRLYARILNAAYRALKARSSRNVVIGGNTYTAAGPDSISTYQWLRYMRLPSGARPQMDLWGHNPFSFRIPNLKNRQSAKGRVDFSDLRRLTRRLDISYPGKKLRLFLSEFGVPGGSRIDAELGYRLNYRAQVRWIRAAFRVQKSFRRIYTLGWVHPFDRPDVGITTGLLRSDGTPKPGYWAFRGS